MKAYNEYMDNLSVSETLHQKLVSCVGNAKSKHPPVMFRRYAVAFICLAVVLYGIFAIPQSIQQNILPAPEDNPSVLLPGSITPTPGASSKYTLYFNKADAQTSAANIAIPGHFWQELTEDELKAVFPALVNTHSLTATANFKSDENGAELFNIDANAVSASSLKSYIQISPGEVVLDYGFDSEPKASDVLGTAVTAGYFESKPNSNGQRMVLYFASFKLSGVAYYVELGGAEAKKEALKNEISELIGLLIEGGAADLAVFHPVIPELRSDRLNLEDARAEADFGAYIPVSIPAGFVFEDALRYKNQINDTLFVHWTKGMGYIEWHISRLKENDKARSTSVADTKNYNLSFYPVPFSESVPDELREIVNNPIFSIDELTLEAVQARAYEVSDAGDEPGQRMRFSVLYGDVLVELSVKGASPEAIFELLQQIEK